MDQDIVRMNSLLKADVKWLKDHGIMDFSLLLAAERYVAGTFRQNGGALLDPETPRDAQARTIDLELDSINASING